MNEQIQAGPGETSAPQVVDRSSNPGRPASLLRTLSMTTAALVLSVVVTGMVAQRGESRFTGVLNAEVSRLSAPADGIVEWMDVKPGQIVLPGTELFIIRDTQLEERIRKARLTLDGFRIDLAAAAARAELEIQQRTTTLDSEAFDTELTLTGLLQQQFQHDFESTALGDYIDLFDSLASTEIPPVNLKLLAMPDKSQDFDRLRAMIERSEVENSLEALQTRIDLCEARLKELRDAIDALPTRVEAAHRIPVIQASIDSTTAQLQELQSLEAERTVNSPIYGMAGVLRVQELEAVSEGDLLVEIFDRDREFVSVSLPMSLVATLESGQEVTLHFPNDEERHGRIDSIPPQLMAEQSGPASEATFPVKVLSVGKPWPTLPIGSALEVSIEE
ncbi:MAG: HlyD family efflux transporter periplasmic adaptor subunit [Planctomycetota bacterium]|nr:HlyD family efflux transporter periplasmic adaptor subunit [Planctomycetota bacterium]MDA0920382.1 HlyD family efflux transporter periplasmic adaptor subunit [Planctomycetota bacterium]MDA1159649.1 HlyD family efflux transporter periplasmic adaptor subunit [Planctomycetota bacterium]